MMMAKSNGLKSLCWALAALSLLATAPSVSAGELRFNFRNPNFGGNPFLGEFLINSAQLQNQHNGGGSGGGGGDGVDGGVGENPLDTFQIPNPDDFATGTTVIVGAPSPN